MRLPVLMREISVCAHTKFGIDSQKFTPEFNFVKNLTVEF